MIDNEALKKIGKSQGIENVSKNEDLLRRTIGAALICLLISSSFLSPAFAQVNAGAPQQAAISPLKIEEAKLEASADTVRYYVIKAVYVDTNLTENEFKRMPVEEKYRITSDAFYLASLQLANSKAWPSDMVKIIESVLDNNSPKDTMLRFESAYYKTYGAWPDVVAVDVDSINERFQESLRIR